MAITGLLMCSCQEKKTESNALSFGGLIEYVIDFDSVSWATEVRVNDIIVIPKEENSGRVPITHLVRKGVNAVTVTATQSTDIFPDPLTVVVLSLTDDDPEGLEVIRFSEDPSENGAIYEKTLEFEASVPIEWVWETIPPVEALTPTDRTEILSELTKLYTALEAKDMEAFRRVRSLAIDGEARLRGIPAEEVTRGVLAMVQKALEDPNASLEMRPSDEIVMKICGPCVFVNGKGRRPWDKWVVQIVLERDEKHTRALTWDELLFCKVDGKWRIIK